MRAAGGHTSRGPPSESQTKARDADTLRKPPDAGPFDRISLGDNMSGRRAVVVAPLCTFLLVLACSAGSAEGRFGWGQKAATQRHLGVLHLRGGAEAGKGDPRWIVQDRKDGRNVNSWHWEEKDMTQWAKQRLGAIVGIKGQVEGCEGEFQASYEAHNITRIGGDVVIHQRKGRLWPLCDLEICVHVKGTMTKAGGEPVEVDGDIFFSDVTVDERDDLEYQVTVPLSGPERDAFRKWLRSGGSQPIIEGVQAFLDDLQSHANAGQDDCAKAAESAASTAKEAAAKMAQVNKIVAGSEAKATPSDGGGQDGSITIEEEFQAGAADLFDCFFDANKLSTWTRCSDTIVERREGGRFSLFSGQISGGIQQISPPEFVQCQWRMQDWPTGCYSSVRLQVHEMGDRMGCKLVLTQDNIPSHKVEEVERQWRQRFFQQIKVFFGYGAVDGARLPF